MKQQNLLLLCGILLGLTGCNNQADGPNSSGPLNQAHGHNDYEQQRPLLDALGHGFMSVEADVFTAPLLGLDLYVAHDPQDITFDRTLRSLYLEPMRARVATLGAMQGGQEQPFQLLIDFKTEAESTWQVLEEQLEPYADLLTRYEDGVVIPGFITVVISGNRPTTTLASLGRRLAFIDGRLPDLENPPPAELVPLISDNWTSHFSWMGAGPMPDSEQQKLAGIMANAEMYGYRIRFWATPDTPGPERVAIWTKLWAAGVHHINTDDLAALEVFLRERQAN
jgi:hypothetical protein